MALLLSMLLVNRSWSAKRYITIELSIRLLNGFPTKPTTLSHAEAATVPLAALTSYQGLFQFCRIKEGHKV